MNRRKNRRPATTEAALIAEPDLDEEAETGPLRRCVVSRERLPKERMIRFVIGPDRSVVPDLAARLPGRGMWLDPGSRWQDDGHRTLGRALSRAARGQVTLPPDFGALLQASLRRRIAETLGLARRAGQAIAGFEKAREWVRGGRARLVLQASDGSSAERARFLSGIDPSVALCDPLPAAELGRIFGRDHAVHVAVSPGKLADTLMIDTARLTALKHGAGPRDRRDAATTNEAADANG